MKGKIQIMTCGVMGNLQKAKCSQYTRLFCTIVHTCVYEQQLLSNPHNAAVVKSYTNTDDSISPYGGKHDCVSPCCSQAHETSTISVYYKYFSDG